LASHCLCVLVDEVAGEVSLAVSSSARGDPARPMHAGPGLDAATSWGALPAHVALWLYGLMVRLEQPVAPDVAAALRSVVVVAESGLHFCEAERSRPSHGSNGSSADLAAGVADTGAAHAALDGGDGPGLHESSPGTVPAHAPARASGGDGDCAALVDTGARSGADGAQEGVSSVPARRVEGGLDPGEDEVMVDGVCGDTDGGCAALADAVARYDTLRVLAGGFFGQDSTLAPLVHEYLVRINVR
jgi:hypothetical protein